ncbi:MAG: tRNA uridine-5-carboxymethylaminomethyl(34) synthesis enzyme MnmG, partial [Christensenellaceae bacterium]
IQKQLKQVEAFHDLEDKRLRRDFDYSTISGLRLEARAKLNDIKPENIGQAARISGVSPSDVTVLLINYNLMSE